MDSKKRFLESYECCDFSVFLETLGGRIRDCNEAALAEFGYSREEMVDLSAFDLVPHDVRKTFADVIVEELHAGGVNVDAIGLRKNGSTFPSRVATRVVDVDGEQMALVTVHSLNN